MSDIETIEELAKKDIEELYARLDEAANPHEIGSLDTESTETRSRGGQALFAKYKDKLFNVICIELDYCSNPHMSLGSNVVVQAVTTALGIAGLVARALITIVVHFGGRAFCRCGS